MIPDWNFALEASLRDAQTEDELRTCEAILACILQADQVNVETLRQTAQILEKLDALFKRPATLTRILNGWSSDTMPDSHTPWLSDSLEDIRQGDFG